MTNIDDLILSSPKELCEMCGKEWPSATLMPLSRTNHIIVCMDCAMKRMSDNPFLRGLNGSRK